MLAVVDPETDEILGGCDLSDLDGDGPADVGYWVAAAHRGQNVAVRAVAALLGWARRDLGIDAFALELEPDNAASVAVATSAGLRTRRHRAAGPLDHARPHARALPTRLSPPGATSRLTLWRRRQVRALP